MKKSRSPKTELIHMLEETWRETKKGRQIETSEQFEVIAAIDATLYFLELYDELRGETHKTYFIKRHLSLHNNMTQTRISNEYAICKDSVSAYCAMYVKIFEKCLDSVREMTIRIEKDNRDPKEILRAITVRAVKIGKSIGF